MAFYGTDINDNQFNNANFTQYGGDGNDALGKSTASFRAYGGDGNDTLYQNGTGYIDAWGGYGNDWLQAALSTSSNYIYGDEGRDAIITGNGADNLDGGQEGDAIYGGGGNDVIYGGDGDDTNSSFTSGGIFTTNQVGGLYGQAGDDYIDGGRGNDWMDGGANNDTMLGGLGNDHIDGGTGNDLMRGGFGDDDYFVDSAADLVYEASDSGFDEVFTTTSFQLASWQSIETLATTNNAGFGAINLNGNQFSNTVIGNAGSNVINGNTGVDVLYGLGGSDIFQFNNSLGTTNHDSIIDFSVAADTFYLENASGMFSLLAAGGLAAIRFCDLSLQAQSAGNVIIYDRANGNLYYDFNGIAAGGQSLFADVTNGLALTAADFFVT